MIDVVVGPFVTLPSSDAQSEFEGLLRGALEYSTEAADLVNSFTRAKMREDGFYRRIMPPVAISSDELDRSVYTNEPRTLRPTFSFDTDELRATSSDLRLVLADNAIKDMLAEEDARFMATVYLNQETMEDVKKWGA